jgi:hypothetical protein
VENAYLTLTTIELGCDLPAALHWTEKQVEFLSKLSKPAQAKLTQPEINDLNVERDEHKKIVEFVAKRISQARTFAQKGQYARIAEVADDLTKKIHGDAYVWLSAARCQALALAAIRDSKPPQGLIQQALAAGYARNAIDALRKAAQFGFRDVGRLERDSDFAALRGLQEYTELITQVRDMPSPLRSKEKAK